MNMEFRTPLERTSRAQHAVRSERASKINWRSDALLDLEAIAVKATLNGLHSEPQDSDFKTALLTRGLKALLGLTPRGMEMKLFLLLAEELDRARKGWRERWRNGVE